MSGYALQMLNEFDRLARVLTNDIGGYQWILKTRIHEDVHKSGSE